MELYDKALAIRFPIEDHPNVASIYNGLGRVYECQEEYGEATTYYRKVCVCV